MLTLGRFPLLPRVRGVWTVNLVENVERHTVRGDVDVRLRHLTAVYAVAVGAGEHHGPSPVAHHRDHLALDVFARFDPRLERHRVAGRIDIERVCGPFVARDGHVRAGAVEIQSARRRRVVHRGDVHFVHADVRQVHVVGAVLHRVHGDVIAGDDDVVARQEIPREIFGQFIDRRAPIRRRRDVPPEANAAHVSVEHISVAARVASGQLAEEQTRAGHLPASV